jgi:hypothetical protein
MIHGDDLEAYVRAFREATATQADGRATRARVLAGAGNKVFQRRIFGRLLLSAAVGLLVLTTAAAAWTGMGWWRRVPPAKSRSEHADIKTLAIKPLSAKVPSLDVALPDVVLTPDPPLPRRPDHAADSDGEASAYELAHRAHFSSRSPKRALLAWDAYLRDYPHGVFALEANFNRALCLVLLGRYSQAAVALKPFAVGKWHGYRREEANTLLGWMSENATASIHSPEY